MKSRYKSSCLVLRRDKSEARGAEISTAPNYNSLYIQAMKAGFGLLPKPKSTR